MPAPTSSASRPRHVVVGVVGVLLLPALAVVSLLVGSGTFSPQQVFDALLLGDGSETDLLLIREYRGARTALAILVGIALGLAGGVMQAVTRNPLADPGILGVGAGSYLAVVVAAAMLGPLVGLPHVLAAMAGALVVSIGVYGIGATGPAAGTTAKLVLTGVALGAVFSGVSYALTLLMPRVFERVRFWNAGSLQGRTFDEFWTVLPFIVVGAAIALMLPRALGALALGDDVAVSLGSKPGRTRLVGVAAVTLLCGAATAVAGPISFVGLMIPHALRSLVGPDWRAILPLSCIAAPVLMLTADILARVIAPTELPVGVVMAALGAPVLIALVRRKAARA